MAKRSKPFKLPSHLVLDLQDISDFLSMKERQLLSGLVEKISHARRLRNQDPVDALVVEKGWPEYKALEARLQRRVMQENCCHDMVVDVVARQGKICRHCKIKEH